MKIEHRVINEIPGTIQMPAWLGSCNIVSDWCKYNGVIYYGVLNWQESEKRNKPVIDLAYCATRALNEIFLKQRVFSKRFELYAFDRSKKE